jgi:replicative DNA helicase
MNAIATIPATAVANMRFESEMELVGTLLKLADAASCRAAKAIVAPQHFQDQTMARLFHFTCTAAEQGLTKFGLTHWVMMELRADERVLADAGLTPSKLVAMSIATAKPEIALEGQARQVRYDHLNTLLDLAAETGDLDQVQSLGAEMEGLRRAHMADSTDIESVGTIVERVVNELNQAYQTETPVKDYAAITLGDLRRMLGGWRRKRYYVIAGRPGMGKSTLSLSTLLRTAMQGHGVMLFALEMGRNEVSEIALCDLAWSRHRRIEYRDISSTAVHHEGFPEKFSELLQVQPLFKSLPFYITDKGGLTVADVRSQALHYRQHLHAEGKRLDVICIDHLGLLKSTGQYRGNKVAETEEVSAALKELAKELDCAVVALAQLSRQTEGREDKRPTLSDLRWSGGIEQDADCVMMVYREEYYLKKQEVESEKEVKRQAKLEACKNTLQVFIEKQRGGPTGEVKLFCDIGCGVVRDLEGNHG